MAKWRLSDGDVERIRFSKEDVADLKEKFGSDLPFIEETTEPTSFRGAELDGIYVNEDDLPALKKLVGRPFHAVTSPTLIEKRQEWEFPGEPIEDLPGE